MRKGESHHCSIAMLQLEIQGRYLRLCEQRLYSIDSCLLIFYEYTGVDQSSNIYNDISC